MRGWTAPCVKLDFWVRTLTTLTLKLTGFCLGQKVSTLFSEGWEAGIEWVYPSGKKLFKVCSLILLCLILAGGNSIPNH